MNGKTISSKRPTSLEVMLYQEEMRILHGGYVVGIEPYPEPTYKRRIKLMLDEKLTFGELEVNDKFIAFPTPGDDDGHGGYKGVHFIFRKVSDYESVKEKYGTLSFMPKTMAVIKVE